LYPGADVHGYLNGSLKGGKAFGVAVPDVDIVVSVCTTQLAKRTQNREEADFVQQQKCAIRACIDRLVNVVGLKFRRSAFRGREPKVTLIAPASLGIFDEVIPLDLSINSVNPARNAAMLEDLNQFEPRVKALTLLVKRWAKDRGICHAAKGHFPPYVWTQLSIFFLQAGLAGSPLVAPLDEARRGASACPDSGPSVAELLKGFMRFYANEFEWCQEAVSVRLGRRAAPDASLPPQILHDDDGNAHVAPVVEDPFDQTCNLGDGMTAASLRRLHEEFARADALCAGDASLAVLLEPWIAPSAEKNGGEGHPN
jgi:DNA polymerase sigma